MEFFNKAKELFDSATVKAGELVYDQKCNIKIAKVCAEMKKAYEKLGRLSYRKIKGLNVSDDEINSIVTKIEILKQELDCLRDGETDFGGETFQFTDEETNEDN